MFCSECNILDSSLSFRYQDGQAILTQVISQLIYLDLLFVGALTSATLDEACTQIPTANLNTDLITL